MAPVSGNKAPPHIFVRRIFFPIPLNSMRIVANHVFAKKKGDWKSSDSQMVLRVCPHKCVHTSHVSPMLGNQGWAGLALSPETPTMEAFDNPCLCPRILALIIKLTLTFVIAALGLASPVSRLQLRSQRENTFTRFHRAVVWRTSNPASCYLLVALP